MQIFLSYASEQKDIAESIALSLRGRRHKVFFDRDDLPDGEGFDEPIQLALKAADRFIFLISPNSVERGAYTLTELSYARDEWPSPGGYVLPVMAVATPFEHIPPYLKAVTILEPEGNIAAETSVAIGKMRGGSWSPGLRRAAAVVGLACIAATTLGYMVYSGHLNVYSKPTLQSHAAQIVPNAPIVPYGIYMTGITDPQVAVQQAEKVRSIAQSIGREGNEVRLYKRNVRSTGSSLWAVVIIYTDSTVASGDVSKFQPVQNGWDSSPEVINIGTWCPNVRAVASPTGSEIKFKTLDCT